MATSLARDMFDRLLEQVKVVESVAARLEADGDGASAPVLRRSGFVLTVAAVDSFFHERGIPLLAAHAKLGATEAASVANYVQSVSAQDASGAFGESHIRMRLSYKTLASPRAIDSLLGAIGLDADSIWLSIAFGLSTRPDRLKRLLELHYDRRNQIAHEADWDVGRLEFRPMERAHLADCMAFLCDIVEGFEVSLPS